jgi:hypothetical protein
LTTVTQENKHYVWSGGYADGNIYRNLPFNFHVLSAEGAYNRNEGFVESLGVLVCVLLRSANLIPDIIVSPQYEGSAMDKPPMHITSYVSRT